ncbi:MAG TPA: hypothetical protein DCL73_07100 [Treponema sp.]|nr:hypothetical protein [Treponema sp.]
MEVFMNKMKTVLAACAVFAVSLVAASAQKATIDYRFNTVKDDGKNYFNWSADGKSVKDSFDAASGASKVKSTAAFDVVRFDSTGKRQAIPGGLRGLMLYPVASRATADDDAFTVKTEGKKVTITFVHRGTAYKVTSDDKGVVDLASGFQIAKDVGANLGGKFILKDEFVKAGGNKNSMADLDWSKVTFAPDTADAAADYKYTGTLTTAVKDGILTIKSSLTKVK